MASVGVPLLATFHWYRSLGSNKGPLSGLWARHANHCATSNVAALVAQYGNTDTDTDTGTDTDMGTDPEGLKRAANNSPEALELAGMSLGPLHCA